MRLEQIDHIALHCASPEATKSWYVSTLGFEHVFPGEWSGVPIFLRLGSTYIALFPQKKREPQPSHSAVSHLAFRAATYADFRSAQMELQERGVSFEFQDHKISHSIYFLDPDGFLLRDHHIRPPREMTRRSVIAASDGGGDARHGVGRVKALHRLERDCSNSRDAGAPKSP